jgi:allantoin racemase
MLGHRFSVITTLSRSIAAIETNLLKYGLASRFAKVRACEVPVLSLDDPASNAAALISAEIELARREDNAEVVVLGCAGMADLAARLSEQHGLPVVDGVASAIKLAEALGVLGLKTSKIGSYAAPRPKAYLGSFASFAPR